MDGAWCHGAFAQNRHLHFPLLADFEPKGAVARQYGAYRAADGVCERALFVIDKRRIIASELLPRRLPSIQVRTVPRRRSKSCRNREEFMATLKVPVTVEDHAQGPQQARM